MVMDLLTPIEGGTDTASCRKDCLIEKAEDGLWYFSVSNISSQLRGLFNAKAFYVELFFLLHRPSLFNF